MSEKITTGEDAIRCLSEYATESGRDWLENKLQDPTRDVKVSALYRATESDFLAADAKSKNVWPEISMDFGIEKFRTALPFSTRWHELAEIIDRPPSCHEFFDYMQTEAKDDFIQPCTDRMGCSWKNAELILRACKFRLAKAHWSFLREGQLMARMISEGLDVLVHPVADITFGSDIVVLGGTLPVPVSVQKGRSTKEFFSADGTGSKLGARGKLSIPGVLVEAVDEWQPNGKKAAIFLSEREMVEAIQDVRDVQAGRVKFSETVAQTIVQQTRSPALMMRPFGRPFGAMGRRSLPAMKVAATA